MFSLYFLTTAFFVGSSDAIAVKLGCPPSNPDNIAGACHSSCGSGWEGQGSICVRNCPSGWTGVGPSCNRWDPNISCKSRGCGLFGWFPCCKGGWRISVRDTKTRNVQPMLVMFTLPGDVQRLGKECLRTAGSIVEDVTGKAEEMVGKDNNLNYLKSSSHSQTMENKMHHQKGRLNSCAETLRNLNGDWIPRAVAKAIAYGKSISKLLGRRRMELHEAGDSAVHLNKPVVVHESATQVVTDHPDGSTEVEMTQTEFEASAADFVTQVVEKNFAEEAKDMSDDEKAAFEEKMRKNLMSMLFDEDSVWNQDLSIDSMLASEEEHSTLERLLKETESGDFEAGQEEGTAASPGEPSEQIADEGRRRLGDNTHIDNCYRPAFLISVGAAIDSAGATGAASLDQGYSSCGLGLFYTLEAGIATEISGIEGYVSYNVFGRGKDIPGDFKWTMVGFDIKQTLGFEAEPLGFELNIYWGMNGDILGAGWTISAGFGYSPLALSIGLGTTKLISRT